MFRPVSRKGNGLFFFLTGNLINQGVRSYFRQLFYIRRSRFVNYRSLEVILKKTGAQIIIDALIQEKVKVVFGYPGGVVIPIFDVLYDTKELEFILLVN